MDGSPGPRENWDAPDIWLYPEGETPPQDYRGPSSYQPNADPSGPPSYNQPSYGQPGYNQSGYNQPSYGQPGYNQSGYNQSGYNQSGYNQPGYNQSSYGQPGYNQPGYNQPGYNQPGYGAPESGQPPYPPPNYGPPGYPPPNSGPGFGPGNRPSEPSRGPRRKAWWLIAAAACVVLVLVVALVNAARGNNNRTANAGPNLAAPTAGVPLPGGSAQPGPSGSAGSGNSGGTGGGSGQSAVPAVSCPVIRDEESHLQYSCIDDYLNQSEPDNLLGLRIALSHEVEPGWLISEGSGNPKSVVTPPDDTTVAFHGGPSPTTTATPTPAPSAADVQTEVKRRIASALDRGAYGDNATSRTFAAHTRSFGGVTGYEIVTYITLDPAFRAKEKLADKTERLWTVGIPTAAGVSIFMMSIPDARSDLWPLAEATVGTIKVI
ncbi:MAG: hypothetical protein JWN95_567 [Frankiales bacterium]|nr:hypothetical protein [Frankiales bacterium]